MNDEVTQYLDRVAERDPVPCAGCTACCRGDSAVVVKPELGDDIDQLGKVNMRFERVSGRIRLVLKRQPNGDCTFLRNGACSIYERRPAVCRHFDCRRVMVGLSRSERRELTRLGLFPKEVVNAAMDRMGTLKMEPGEERMQLGWLLLEANK